MQENEEILADAPAGVAVMRQFIPTSPFARHLRLEIDALEPDHARLRLPYKLG